MASTVSIRFVLSALAMAAVPASAQQTCTAPSSDTWMTGSWSSGPEIAPIGHERIFEISPPSVPDAVTTLSGVAAVALDKDQAVRFLGSKPESPAVAKLRPYLVRAVYPVGNPVLFAQWAGAILEVGAGGMGCHRFVKHPVIIFLERAPESVSVTASATL